MKVIDNFLGKDLIQHLEKMFLFNQPHFYGHYSKESTLDKSNLFYNSNINLNDFLIQFIYSKVEKTFNINRIIRAYINIQYNGMDGDWHVDEGHNTILLMVTKSLKKGSGEFQIKENNKINKIQFVQDRIILFNASSEHKGMSPIEINTPRITFAFKTI